LFVWAAQPIRFNEFSIYSEPHALNSELRKRRVEGRKGGRNERKAGLTTERGKYEHKGRQDG
jgi:hypothetical protein